MKKDNQIDLRSVNKKSPIAKSLRFRNPFKKQSGQQRDDQGKFAATTGSTGVQFMKRMQWKRVIPLILIVAIGGGYLVFRSFAAGVRPLGTYSSWSWDVPSGGFTNLSHELTVEEVAQNTGYFWANQFNFVEGDGGYVGLQTQAIRLNDNSTGKTVVFSIFNAAIEATTGSCKIEHNYFDGAPGSGTRCFVAYDWQVGVKYKFRVEKTGVATNGTWWSAWITNTSTNTETFIAQIKVPPTWKGMGHWSNQWTEYYGSLPATCNDVPRSKVRFYKPTRSYNGTNVLPARSETRYATGADCTNSRITNFEGGTIQEMGNAIDTSTGLLGTYYTGTNLKGNFVTRQDANIDFSWWDGAPASGIGNNFSARWTGKLVPQRTDDYTLNLSANDAATVWLDGRALLDTRGLLPGNNKFVTVRLEAGKYYDFALDFYNTSGPAGVRLLWKSTAAPESVLIPRAVFRPTKQPGLSARYSNRGYVVSYYTMKNEPNINHSWGTASPSSGVPVDGFRVNWFGKLKVPTTGTYKLISVSNDGVQLVINNKLLINDWNDGPTRRRETSVKLEAGKEYAISFNYYDATGDATARLLWSGPGIAETVIPASAFTTN